MRKLAIGMLAAALVAGCGGGDDASETGLWTGTTSTSRAVTTIILSDGSYYMLYSPVNNPSAVGGLVVGSGELHGDHFISTGARDYNLEGTGLKAAELSADIATHAKFDGTLTSGTAAPVTFTSGYNADNDASPSLATLAGSYPGQVNFSLGARAGTFVVTAAGAFSTTINGCLITGNVVPRADANAFNMSLTFAGAPCVFPNQNFTGIARLDATGHLYGLAQNAAISQAIVFVGTKQ